MHVILPLEPPATMPHPLSAQRIRFVMVGGFLGAGKTTTLLRLARHYAAGGKRVGIITNDQAEGLVDTLAYREAGFTTEEIPAGCFCCHFEHLLEASGRLADGLDPDIILAEPVGSCTDLVNAVITPLKTLYGNRFDVAPYAAVLDPERAIEALGGEGPKGFSNKVTYIYKMQQNEADIVAVNKADRLTPTKLDQVRRLVRQNFPRAKYLEISGQTGQGFDALIQAIEDGAVAGQHGATVDYEIYAEGEAALGWLNAQVRLVGQGDWDGDSVLSALATRIHGALVNAGAEVAHFKMRLQDGGKREGAVHATSNAGECEVTLRLGGPVTNGSLIVNLRAEAEPEMLKLTVTGTIESLAAEWGLVYEIVSLQAFAPSPPVPPPGRNVVHR